MDDNRIYCRYCRRFGFFLPLAKYWPLQPYNVSARVYLFRPRVARRPYGYCDIIVDILSATIEKYNRTRPDKRGWTLNAVKKKKKHRNFSTRFILFLIRLVTSVACTRPIDFPWCLPVSYRAKIRNRFIFSFGKPNARSVAKVNRWRYLFLFYLFVSHS